MTCLRFLARIFVVVALAATAVFAGGPLIIGNKVLGAEGAPIVWNQVYMPIVYVTDGGTLGALTNAQANLRVEHAFAAWQNVPSAAISFANGGTIANIPGGHVRTVSDLNQVISDCQGSFETAIIYDSDGTLFLDLYSDPNVVGFTGVCAITTDGYILSAFSALNGAYADLGEQFDGAMIHEFGHLIGLDHSQIECLDSCTSVDREATPTMYPVLLGPEQSVLAPDDITWVSTLYPGPTFATGYGHVSGTIFFPDGLTPVQGANVVFRQVDNVATPGDESRANVYSVVSGYRFSGNPGQAYTAHYLPCTAGSVCDGGYLGDNQGGNEFGSRNPAVIGTYDIALPPGTYTVQVESIDPGFSGGSSVGPLSPPIPLPGPSEYWNVLESSTDNVNASSPINVVVGGNLTGTDIILNGATPRFDPFDDCDSGQVASSRSKSPATYVRITGGAR